MSDKQAIIGKAISETDWLWAKPFISVQTQYELTKNILTATDYFALLTERDELKATVKQYGDNIMELCKAIHQHVQRERVMAKVVEAARELDKHRCTGSKADRPDYIVVVPCSELWAVHQALADLDALGGGEK